MQLTKEQWEWVMWEGDTSEDGEFTCIKEIEGEDRRWSRCNQYILKHNPTQRLFCYYRDMGLTEYQPHEELKFPLDLIEVEEYDVIVKEYREKKVV